MDVFFVFLLLFTEIVLLGIAWVLFSGDFISPSIVTLALFILSTACFAYNTNDWNVVFTFKAYSLFTLSFILMIFTERLILKNRIVLTRCGRKQITKRHFDKGCADKGLLYIPRPWKQILFLFFCVCSLYYIYRVYRSGVSLGADSLLESIGYNKEHGEYDGLSRLLYNLTRMSGYVYIVIFCNNVLGCKEKMRKNADSMIVIIFTLVITFFSGQRSSLICYIAAIVVACGIFIYDSYSPERRQAVKKFRLRMVFVSLLIVTLFYLSSNIVKGVNVKRSFIDYITYYFGSTTALMGRIVEDPDLCHTPFAGYFGEKTFNGLWRNLYSLGIVSKAPADRRWIKMGGSVANKAGNEFTFFCAPYIDFGFVGTLVFIGLFYVFFSYIYYWKIRRGKNTIKKYTICSIYLFLYALVAMSFYQDTIRSYTRLINILYIIYLYLFCRFFLRIKRIDDYKPHIS